MITNLLLFWISFPLGVKILVFIVAMYMYLFICIQLFSFFEVKRNKRVEKKYYNTGERLKPEMLGIIESISIGKEFFSPEKYRSHYEKIIWTYLFTQSIRNYTLELRKGNAEVEMKRERLLSYGRTHSMYKRVLEEEKTFGKYNVVAMLGILRDFEAVGEMEKYESEFYQEKNLFQGYNLLTAFAKMGDFARLERLFHFIVERREISEEDM
ncbi:MAG: hypothetical protein ACRCUS_01545, partial [Anaerovoracaceae bacterium]